MKTSRGGKRSGDIITSQKQRTRSSHAQRSEREYVTYTFYDSKLGERVFSGPRRRVMQDAKKAGYTESDLRSRG